jgi:hypothetical protein
MKRPLGIDTKAVPQSIPQKPGVMSIRFAAPAK